MKGVITTSESEPIAVQAIQSLKKRNALAKVVSVIGNLIFFALLFLVAIIIGMTFSQNGGRPRVIWGYSVYIVLTGSMQSEIPQGSLVVVNSVDSDTIQIGDDITFIREDHSIITHRVISVSENYQQSGMRGFVTKGTENPEPDKDVVYENNVVGKVVFHSLWLGSVLSYVQDRVWVIILITVLIVAFFTALRYAFRAFKKQPELPQDTDVPVQPTDSRNV